MRDQLPRRLSPGSLRWSLFYFSATMWWLNQVSIKPGQVQGYACGDRADLHRCRPLE